MAVSFRSSTGEVIRSNAIWLITVANFDFDLQMSQGLSDTSHPGLVCSVLVIVVPTAATAQRGAVLERAWCFTQPTTPDRVVLAPCVHAQSRAHRPSPRRVLDVKGTL
jgi:hypothetical protein